MPPKIKELIHELEKAGFVNRGGKGSHRNYTHPNGSRITISGQLSEDAKPYQVRETKKKIQEAK
jgi:predicted RNA binding protein YcfA (HicA-like mRNA interferase family)